MNRLLKSLTHTLIFLFLYHFTFASDPYRPLSFTSKIPDVKEIESLIQKRSGVFDLRTTAETRQFITSYTTKGRRGAQKTIGRSQIYFPVIEKYLKIHGLPDELKYLTVVESALNPRAQSGAGAVGLWQLMPATARRYGLTINQQVDERRDPHKSTQAALKYLRFLYNLLGDWTLAAAAYNCGGGGVQKAIRKAGGKKGFWKIKNHLPQQTQHYISRLAGAIYVMNYYDLHSLKPSNPEYFMKFTRVATIYNQLSFDQISQALDIPVPVLRQLNPSYKKEMLPDSIGGNYLILPKMKMDSFIHYYTNVVAGKSEEVVVHF